VLLALHSIEVWIVMQVKVQVNYKV